MEKSLASDSSRFRLCDAILRLNDENFVFLTSKEGKLGTTFASPALMQRFGVKPDELFSHLARSIVWDKESTNNLVTLPLPAGDFILSYSVSFLAEEESPLAQIAVTGRDLTAEQRQRQHQQESDELVEEVIKKSRDLLIIHDAGTIKYASSGAAKMVGAAKPEDLIGASFYSFIAEEYAATIIERERQLLLEQGEAVENSGELLTKGGQKLFVMLKERVITFQGRQMFLVMASDISELVATENHCHELWERIELAKKQESMVVMAGGIAHDFNNMLSGIIGNANLLSRELPDNAAAQQFLGRIELAARQAADLTRQLVTYATGSGLELSPIYLKNIINDMLSLLRASIPRCVELKFNCQEQVEVLADASQIRQVVMNLLINAAEAISMNRVTGLVTIVTRALRVTSDDEMFDYLKHPVPIGKYVILEVTDNGPGIPADHIEKIFDPMYSTKKKSRGLGLASLLGIVRNHNGFISVDSILGVGTTVRIYLPQTSKALTTQEIVPLSREHEMVKVIDMKGENKPVLMPVIMADQDEKPPMAKAESQEPIKERRAGGTVLVIDDEQALLSIAKLALEIVGYQVDAVSSGEDGLELLHQNPHKYAVILTDFAMPGLSGVALLKAITALDSSIPIVLTSGYSWNSLKGQIDIPIAGYLQKPFGASDIARAVDMAQETPT